MHGPDEVGIFAEHLNKFFRWKKFMCLKINILKM